MIMCIHEVHEAITIAVRSARHFGYNELLRLYNTYAEILTETGKIKCNTWKSV